MLSALLIEIVLTAGFLIVILGTTHGRAPVGFAPIAIGLALTLIHLISIPVTNTSVNPARSTSQALFAGGGAIGQLWLFWVAPIVGAVLGAIIWKAMGERDQRPLIRNKHPVSLFRAKPYKAMACSIPSGRLFCCSLRGLR